MDATPRPAAKECLQEPVPPERPPADRWLEALDRLQHQMSADTFASLLRDSHVVEATRDTWTIGVRPHAVQWLSNRPYPLIREVVSCLAGREVNLEYVAKEQPAVL
ncbi:MAG: hypothetical protein GWN58_55495, partial [Anaerolineae bacterium]|nr:hypothetical protein [Anaerolineae bacterium]